MNLAEVPLKAGIAGVLVLGVAAAASVAVSRDSNPGVGVQLISNGNGNANSSNSNGQGNGHSVSVTGVVIGALAPGRTAQLQVTVSNPNNQNVTLTSVQPAIGVPSSKNCLASWFTVGSFTGSTPIAKNSTARVTLALSMRNTTTNQDACKDATLPLSFSASVTG